MTRFFKVELPALNQIRLEVIAAQGLPNGRADEPWPLNGSFHDGAHGYLALPGYYCTGSYEALVDRFIDAPGVEEIDETAYLAAMPTTEEE